MLFVVVVFAARKARYSLEPLPGTGHGGDWPEWGNFCFLVNNILYSYSFILPFEFVTFVIKTLLLLNSRVHE